MVKSPLVMPMRAPAVRWAGLVVPPVPIRLLSPIPSNGINNRPIHRGWEFADAWFEVGVEEVVGVEGVVEVAEVG